MAATVIAGPNGSGKIRHVEEMLRRFTIAKALLKNPDILVLDEPFYGLDDAFHGRVSRIIEAFCSREGKTLIMVSHYKEDFVPCIDRHFTLTKTE